MAHLDRPDWLAAESDIWRRDGLINDDQRRAILARYAAPAPADDRTAASVLTWLAVLAAGMGAVVLVAWNWASIPDTVKGLITAGPMIALYAAAVIAARTGRQVRAERLALLAALFAGGALLVTEDLVHLNPARAQTALIWAAVLGVTALLTPSALTAAVGAVVLLWWLVSATDSGAGPWWFLAVWALLAAAVERAPIRAIASAVGLAFGVFVFFAILHVWQDQPVIPAIGLVLAGAWLDSFARAADRRHPAFAQRAPALVVTMVGLIVLSVSEAHRAMTDWRLVSGSIWPGAALLAALAGGIAWNLRLSGGWRSRPAALAALAVPWLLSWMAWPAAARASGWGQWLWTWTFSAALVLVGASAVRDAARLRRVSEFAIGLLCVLAFVIVRVADARSVVTSGLMLLASAALLWWLGRMWARPHRPGAAS